MDTSAHAFHLTNREQPIWRDLFFGDPKVVAKTMQYLVCTTNHAWCGYTNLDMVFAHWFVVEHAVESCTLKNTLLWHTTNLSNLQHSWQWYPAAVLPLRKVQ